MHLSREALVQKARAMVTSYDFTQHQRKVPMSKHQAAIRHMRKKVEEQKVERFKADMAAQHDWNRLVRAKEEECENGKGNAKTTDCRLKKKSVKGP